MKIALASDHAGFEMKEFVKSILKGKKDIRVTDFGPENEESVDYPDYGKPAAKSVADKDNDRAILVCGTGLGMSITANKIKGIRATLCHNEYTAEMARRHNNSNVLVLGGRVLSQGEAEGIVKVWLETGFEGGRHQRRLDKIEE